MAKQAWNERDVFKWRRCNKPQGSRSRKYSKYLNFYVWSYKLVLLVAYLNIYYLMRFSLHSLL